MEIGHLKYFYAVAKEKGFSRAALVLKVAQPAISKFVKGLEEELGGALFERGPREVKLTKLGADLYRHCEIIFNEFDSLKTKLGNQKVHTISGNLNLGAVDGVASYLVPEVHRRILKKYPDISLWMASGQASDLCAKVKAGQLETAWLFHVGELDRGLMVRDTFPIPYALVVATPFAKSKDTLCSFIGSREVDNTAVSSYPTLKRLQKSYPDARIRMSTNSFSAHKEMVLRGMGVAILPRYMVAHELKNGKLKELFANEKFAFDLKLVTRTDRMLSSPSQVFVEVMKSVVKELPAK